MRKKLFLVLINLFLLLFIRRIYADMRPGMYMISVKNDACIMSMGEGGRSLISGISSLYLNPAGLISVKGTELEVSYSKYFADYNLFTVGAAHNFIKYGAIAASISYFKAADMELLDLNGNNIGVAQFKDIIFNVGYSYKIIKKYLRGGIKFKFLHKTLYNYTGSAYAFDIGLSSKILFFPVALTIENIGSSSMDGVNIPLPQIGALSIAYKTDFQGNKFSFSIDGKSYLNVTDMDIQYLLGIIYSYKNLSIRSGYNLNTGEVSLGTGILLINKIKMEVGYSLRNIESLYSVNLKYYL